MHKTEKIKYFLYLHLVLLLYSFSSICSKMAALQEFFSLKFILFYGGVLALLFLYAVLWQQIIKKMSLTTAYANKAVIVLWGMLWGHIIFNEKITFKMLIGSVIILFGVYLVVSCDE